MDLRPEFKGVIIEEHEDPRNYTISQFIPNRDIIADSQFMLPFPEREIIIDQGRYNACVGHSFATIKSILEYQHTNKWIDFDPFMIYGTRYSGEYNGEGMVPAQGAKVLYKDGAFLRRDFNIQQEMPMIKDTVEAWKAKNPNKVSGAKDYKITGYAFVNNENAIKTALKNNMPVSVAYPIYESFYETGNDGRVPVVKYGEKNYGNHQMTIVGWTNDHWIVVNSWGSFFGLKGMYLIPFENKYNSAISVSDTITPSLRKAKEMILTIGDTNYTVDGQKHTLDSVPYIRDSRTFVPIRFITESLGCSVQWLDKERKILIRSEESDIILTADDKIITVNSKNELMDTCPEITNNRTMVPIRFISEYLNCKVFWYEDKQQVVIKAL